MVQQGGLVDGAGVVVQTSCDGQVHSEVGFGNTESTQVGADGLQLGKAGVEHLIPAHIALQCGKDFGVGAGDGDEFQDLVCLCIRKAAVLQQDDLHLGRADLVQLINGPHDLAGLFAEAQHGVEAVQNLAVVDPDLEAAQAEALEDLVDDGGDLRLVQDIQLAVADDVNVRLVEFPEAAPLGTLAPVDLADLEAAEGEGQVVVVQGHVFCQRHGQVKAQGQVAVALGEAVDLLLRLAAALGKQNLGILDDGGIQRGKAVGSVGGAQDLGHFLKTDLLGRQQLHKAGQRPGLDDFHDVYFLSVNKSE